MMNKFLSRITVLLVAICFAGSSYGTHLIGGEITWVCLKSGPNAGQFVFTLKVYRECSSGSAGLPATNQNLTVWNHPSLSSITCNYVSLTDISPSCYNPSLEYNCGMQRPVGYSGGAVEEGIYVSNPITIAGIPPGAGWIFSWSSCCRPGNIVNTSSGGFALRAIMYPYNGQNTNPCYDSSPQFVEKPATILCIGYPFAYNHTSEDEELDSLVYGWATGYQSTTGSWPPASIVYTGGYSAMSPLPSTFHNPSNVPATVHPQTGVISFESYTPGSHATVVEVAAYKCGQKVASIYRDIPVVLVNCPALPYAPNPANTPPQVSIDAQPVTITQGYQDTVYAGSQVCFRLQSLDVEWNDAARLIPQQNTLKPTSSQFGNNFTDTANGCLRPPCATLQHPTTGGAPVLSNAFGIDTRFCWHTTCDHLPAKLGCVSLTSTYNFILKVSDDWCPVPGINFLTVSITVKAPPVLPAPSLRCASVDAAGNVILSWDTVKDTLSSFYSYNIYYSPIVGGPYTLIDSVMNNGTGSYIDNNPGRNAYAGPPGYYYLQTRSSCYGQVYSSSTDTLQPIVLNVTGGGSGTATLTWNPLVTPPLATSNGYYYIYREAPLGVWTLVDSTMNTNWSEPVTVCWDSINYRVEMRDNLPCTSVSTIDGDWFGAVVGPNSPPIDSVTVNNGIGRTVVTWTHNPTSATTKYGVYNCQGGVLTFLDTVYAPLGTWTDPTSNPNGQVHHYTIIPFDSCDNKGDTAMCHNSMWLRFDSTNHCTHENHIWWNPYSGWVAGVQRYEIWANVNGAGWNLAGSLSGVTLDTMFAHGGLANGNQYCYKVLAFDGNGRSSTSNELCVNVNNLLDSTVLDPPSLRCISVAANQQDVILDWLAPPDPTVNFNEYEVWHATNIGGPYTLLASINNYATLTYTHVGALPGGPNYYYVITKSGCYGNTPSRFTSDTLTPIIVSVVQNDGWSATITWNPIKVPNTSTSTGTYRIMRTYPAVGGPSVQVGTTNYGNEQWLDTIHVCNDSAVYWVEIDDQGGCTSISSVETGYYLDTIPPSIMVLDSVSVGCGGLAHMGWQQHPDGDVAGYYIVKLNANQSNTIIDTVWGRGVTTYTYAGSNAVNETESYAITAFDSCGNTITYNYTYHASMHLTGQLDPCLPGLDLDWTLYNGWPGAASYEVWVRELPAGPWIVATTTNLTYTFSPVNPGSNYEVHIRAIFSGGPQTSTSNCLTINTTLFAPPAWNYLQYATVNDTNEIKVQAYVDPNANIKQYQLLRAESRFGPYAFVGKANAGQAYLTFMDNDVLTSSYSYFYKLQALDPCDNLVGESNLGRSILLQVEPHYATSTNKLKFNGYEAWAGGVKEYQIYRDKEGYSNPQHIGTVNGQNGTLTYVDQLAPDLEGNGHFCYQVIAIENDPSFQGPVDTLSASNSVSNVACVFHEPIVYIPNAYIPGSPHSPTFRPSLRFVDVENYDFMVFDRWGELLFQTNDMLQGWDGTFKGSTVKTDVYVYLVKFRTSKGEDMEKRGTVTILK